MVPEADDGWPGNYSYIAIDTSPDASVGPSQGLRGGATPQRALGGGSS
jgi:hypothetical protein